MRSSLLRVLAVWCCLTVCVVFAASVDLFGTHAFVGTFDGDEVTLTLELVATEQHPDGRSTYSGSLRHRDRTYPVSAALVHSEPGTITGVFESAGHPFSFAATLAWDTLTFVTDGVSYSLVKQGQQQQDGQPLAYRSEHHGFGLSYPRGWIVTEEPDQVTFAPPGAEGVSFVVYAPWLAAQAGADDRYLFELPLDQVADVMIAALQQELASFRLLERATMINLFAPATRIRFTAVDPDTRQETIATMVIIRTEDAMYSLAYGGPSPSNPGYELGFEAMLTSFGGVARVSHDRWPVRSEPIAATETVRLVQSYLTDATLGMASHTFLIPEGWQQHGGVQWRQAPFPFAAVDVVLFDPHSGAAVRSMSFAHYMWYEPNVPGYAPGQSAVGARIAMPALRNDPQAFLQHVVLPQHFTHVSQLSVVEIVPLLGVAQRIRQETVQSNPFEVESYRARLHYHQDGVALEEDVYFTLEFVFLENPYAQYATPNPFAPPPASQWYWGPAELYGLRANRGELDALTPLLRAVYSSIRASLEWSAIMVAIHRQHDQAIIDAIRQIGDVLTELHQQRSQLADLHFDAWQANQQRRDRIHDAYSQYIRGMQTYQGPGGERVELPAHYPSVWQQQGGGAYIMSMDPSFDPHAGAGGSWLRMR